MYAVSKKIETYCFGKTVIRKNVVSLLWNLNTSVSA